MTDANPSAKDWQAGERIQGYEIEAHDAQRQTLFALAALAASVVLAGIVGFWLGALIGIGIGIFCALVAFAMIVNAGMALIAVNKDCDRKIELLDKGHVIQFSLHRIAHTMTPLQKHVPRLHPGFACGRTSLLPSSP
jgi:hypothetical protein